MSSFIKTVEGPIHNRYMNKLDLKCYKYKDKPIAHKVNEIKDIQAWFHSLSSCDDVMFEALYAANDLLNMIRMRIQRDKYDMERRIRKDIEQEK